MGLKDLPLAKGKQHVKALQSLGWVIRRSEKNHFVLTHPEHPFIHLSIPDHKEVDRRTLGSQVRLMKLTDKQYRAIFDGAQKGRAVKGGSC